MKKSYVGSVAFTLGLALAAVGCGSTRFVVVDNGGSGATGGGAASAPTTAAGGEAAQPATAAETKEFEAAFEQALSIDKRKFAERLKALSGADDLEPTFKAVVDLAEPLGVELEIVGATVSGDTATATVDVIVGGSPFAEGVPVPLVQDDGKWKVTRAGASAVLALGSPCPDAPTS